MGKSRTETRAGDDRCDEENDEKYGGQSCAVQQRVDGVNDVSIVLVIPAVTWQWMLSASALQLLQRTVSAFGCCTYKQIISRQAWNISYPFRF